MKARYWIIFLVFSVLPAPDSPLSIERRKEERRGRDEHGLVLAVSDEVTVGLISDGEDVGSELLTALTSVELDHLISVDGEALVRVKSNAEKARVSLIHQRDVKNGGHK